MKRYLYTSIVLLLLVVGNSSAGQWYGGGDIGYIEHEFTPIYVKVSGEPTASYENEGSGTELGVYGGYIQEINKCLSIACQTRFSANNSEWSMSIPSEPANFKYSQPYTWGISLVPVLNITESTALILEAGLIQGVVNEKKSSSPLSIYDISMIRGGSILGAGISYDINDNVEVSLMYRRTEFDKFAYKTSLPSGEHIETVWDDPVAISWSLGVSYKF